jgi:hypothetical protein
MDEEALTALTNEIATALAPMVRKEMDRRIREGLARLFERRSVPRAKPAAAAVRTEIERGLVAARSQTRAMVGKTGKSKGGELSLEAVKAALQDAAAQGNTKGLRTERLRMAMGLPDSARRRLALVLRKAVSNGEIARKGQKRATTYALKK